MELQLTSDQEFFAETTKRFLEDKSPVESLRAKRNDPDGFDRAFWRQGAELGWTSLLVSEDDGGGSISGGGLADLGLVAFEFGRHAAPGPLVPTNIVAAALSRWGSDEQRSGVLAGLLAGDSVASWADAEPAPNDRLGRRALTATASGDGYVLDGVKSPVEAGGQSDHFLVSAVTPDGLTHLLVAADNPGVTVTPLHSLDLTRRYAKVTFDGATVPASAVVGEPGRAATDAEELLDLAVVIQSHEVVGAMDKAFEITLEWSFDRYSFGRPLASYQELKHRMADMKAWLEAGHAIADAATAHVQDRSERASEFTSSAKSYLGVYGCELVQDCVQFHGGIGVTFEHDMHLYVRRVALGAKTYGTPADHRRRLTDILEAREDAA